MLREGDRVAYEDEADASGTVVARIKHEIYEYKVVWDNPETAYGREEWCHESALRMKNV